MSQDTASSRPTIREDGAHVVVLDQTRLPYAIEYVRLETLEDAAHAIRSMQVRGAPLIGATAAYGVALGLATDASDARVQYVVDTLAATRPTAVNLQWALQRLRRVLQNSALATRRDVAWDEARAIAREDKAANAAIGRHGLLLIQRISEARARHVLARDGSGSPPPASDRRAGEEGQVFRDGDVVNLMTHCNAGRLATVEHGTALAPVYAAHAAGLAVHVWVSETRPRNQGLLTAWELAEAGVPHTLVVDNAAGLLLMQGKVELVIVGADRIAANGDTANKVGTYLKALAAQAHGVPFYVAAPLSTIDFACPAGAEIPIEERAAEEVGTSLAELGTQVANPAFDVTPAALISGIISERGIAPAGALDAWQP
ncbi:MAG: S-methyl-5-thioribose-1-phosphate isomerase [Burkholderiaceae bacterium]|nr:S-methyl-5-thioribose-1-phosphate isomerase [Burkholderiaceae bacterium]MCF8183847.1 S-methyl-5-thioribose-1-phosphate isomerase [Polynucleobacter sp.]